MVRRSGRDAALPVPEAPVADLRAALEGEDPVALSSSEEEQLADLTLEPEAGDERLVEEVESLHQSWWRWVVLWALPGVALFAAVAGLINLVGSGARPNALTTYAPSSTGSTWTYAVVENGKASGQYRVQDLGDVMLLEKHTRLYAEHFDSLLGQPSDDLHYLGYDTRHAGAGQMLDYGVRTDGHGYQATVPPQPVPVLAKVGSNTRWHGTLGKDDATVTTSVVGVERVPAMDRVISGCRHLRTHTSVTGTRTYTDALDTWYCPHLGVTATSEVFDNGTTHLEVQLVLVSRAGPGGTIRGAGAPAVMPSPAEEGSSLETGRAAAVPGHLDLAGLRWSTTLPGDAGASGLVVDGRLLSFAENGTVTATDLATGGIAWTAAVPGPLVAPPATTGSTLLLTDAAKGLDALDAKTGAVLWTTHMTDVAAATPAIADDVVVVSGEDAATTGYRLTDGTELWRKEGETRAAEPPVVQGGSVYLVSERGEVVDREARTGEEHWTAQLEGAARSGPALSDGVLVQADNSGNVFGFDAATGRVRWVRTLTVGVVAHPAAGHGVVVFPTTGDHLTALNLRDGRQRWQVRCGPSSAPPALVGTDIVLPVDHAVLETYRLDDGHAGSRRSLGVDQGSSLRELGYSASKEGDSLIVTERTDIPRQTRILALPITAGATSGDSTAESTAPVEGVRFDVRRVPTETAVRWPVAPLAPGLASGFAYADSHSGYLVVPNRPVKRLRTSKALMPFAVRGPGYTLLQDGTSLKAVRDNTAVAWSAPMGEPYLGVAPVVVGDVVVVPERGIGLLGVDARSGSVRWLHRSADASTAATSPLALPGGLVAYAAGPLSAVDVNSGELRWSVPSIQSVAPLAYSDGTLYVSDSDGGALVAVDAGTGAVRWRAPYGIELLSGPAVGRGSDGVVVVLDSAGNLRGFHITDGSSAWTVAGVRGAVASPLIVGGAVLVDQAGPEEQVSETGHRLVAWSVRTGSWLGSYGFTTGGLTTSGFSAVGQVLLVPDQFINIDLAEVRVTGGPDAGGNP